MDTYNASSIEHLETREAMRTRINMYLGSNDTNGIYQSLKEIINNSTDEALSGYGKNIYITLDEQSNEITVKDEGRGVPFGVENGRNVLVAIYTESHTGGKFNSSSYKTAAGLNGVGGTAVCMSSLAFKVDSYRDNKKATAIFEEGILISYNETEYTGETGTTITFIPDPKVFTDMKEGFSYDRICEEIQNIAYLNKGIHFYVKTKSGKQKDFYSENGIADFIKDKVKKSLMSMPILATATDGTDEVEIAFLWSGDTSQEYVFVNGLYCPEGGSPLTGARTKITTKIKALIDKNLTSDIIKKGLIYAINCKVMSPQFSNQVKNKVLNPSLKGLTMQAFEQGLNEFATIKEFNTIADIIKNFAKAELAAEKAREAALSCDKKMADLRKQKVAFLNKLADAEYLGEDSILCICEGDSAANAIIAGRDTKKYGVMFLRGKMLNGLKEEENEKYYSNEEIELLMYALGIDSNGAMPKKMRYGKIYICVDADK